MTYRIKRPGKGKPPSDENSTFKIKLRGRDSLPINPREWREALLEAAYALKEYEAEIRIKSATIYLTVVDEDGRAVRLNDSNELTIYAYKAAADEYKL